MCAIAGFTGLPDTKDHSAACQNMLGTMTRRGPDAAGTFTAPGITLLHARLAIIDVENGRQPMTRRMGERECTIVYNGELYNTAQLRDGLAALGHRFATQCDTEVLLAAYMEWGEEALQKLNGIFAFAVWDAREQSLFMARDRMGVKPFFYFLKDDRFAFASEIKTLMTLPHIPARLDGLGAMQLLYIGPGRVPGSGVLKDIQELRPGECAVFRNKKLSVRSYWKLEAREHADSPEDTVKKTAELVYDAIHRQLVSDVPVGTFLSGGLDSSLISAVAARELGRKGEQLQTFSVDYTGNDENYVTSLFVPDSDAPYAEKMTRFLDSSHSRVMLDNAALAQALDEAVLARDLPGMADVDSSLLLFCREIRKKVTVALSGECADEIFGGYPWYHRPEILNAPGFPWSKSLGQRQGMAQPGLFGGQDPEDYVYQLYLDTAARAPKLPGEDPAEARMKEMFLLNLNWFMQTLLDRKDRMSMYSGLEVRVPFCDHRIVEYLYNVPWKYKTMEGREKGLLRRAAEGLLPEEVVWRKKSPYPKTHNPVYLHLVSERLRDILADSSSPLLSLVRRGWLENLLGQEMTIPWYGQLMNQPQTIAYFVMLDFWLRSYRVELI